MDVIRSTEGVLTRAFIFTKKAGVRTCRIVGPGTSFE